MRKRQIEQLLREAAKLSGDREFIIIGSQAAYAYIQRPPAEVLLSQECDIYPRNRPTAANFLSHELGKKSRFARKHGCFADVVAPELATLPIGWEKRLKRVEFGPVVAWCLEMHDLVVSKLAAGRLKDSEFAAAMIELRLAKQATLRKRIDQFEAEGDREQVRARLDAVLHDIKVGRAAIQRRAKRGKRRE